ncbi:MAG TPA: bifunctional phosphopantothenoylcysteine decarboxylase/phosphopantothenate--cysteine ligase CoaBC [Candidatus Hydrogenedentes bacterium]|nr:bifunctional phosphopantothenoylcysteine decarboxylase/phosphopantothenate--cysteine ligase CoaBC [Candidatus Hydrogenedentota bacterium]
MAGPFADKEIVLGVTGSIAAYKACEIASRLVEGGARVTAVLTKNAQQFVGPASFEAITGRRTITGMFERLETPEIEHISLARRANLFLIAPATANSIAKAAHGIADDWLSTTLLATRAPVLFAPAMNTHMYQHAATQANIQTLKARGCYFVGPGSGALACGEIGEGRLIDPPAILEAANILLCEKKDLAGKKVLITSGATHEPLDPVRFIGNRSSGKMGRMLALEALRRGASVTVVSGPAHVPLPYDAAVINVKTAQEMLEAVKERFAEADIFIAAAAVADYRIDNPAEEKHKRNGEALTLSLTPNPDIAAYAGIQKRPGQITVGFAAETHDLIAYAEEKLAKKNLDMIVANQVGGENCAFGSDTAWAWLLTPGNPPEQLHLIAKEELTGRIFDAVAALL